jgi:hypothetical protein
VGSKRLKVIEKKLEDLWSYARNTRAHDDFDVGKIAASVQAFGFRDPIEWHKDLGIICGTGRYLAAQKLGLKTIRVIDQSDMPIEQARAYAIANNRTAENSTWDAELLGAEVRELAAIDDIDLEALGFSQDELDEMLGGAGDVGGDGTGESVSLAERFGIPPFSVLNAREGWWQDRKRSWISLGIQSELGRGAPIGGASATPGGSMMPADG